MHSVRNLFATNCRLQTIKREYHQDKASKAQTVTSSNMVERREPNPEYHHAPRSFVKNFQNFRNQNKADCAGLKELNARYRWADFRRRMIYGTHDI